ncbi:MAG: hypothetical protein EHM56_09240, partial [Chloroflexi bacterium]
MVARLGPGVSRAHAGLHPGRDRGRGGSHPSSPVGGLPGRGAAARVVGGLGAGTAAASNPASVRAHVCRQRRLLHHLPRSGQGGHVRAGLSHLGGVGRGGLCLDRRLAARAAGRRQIPLAVLGLGPRPPATGGAAGERAAGERAPRHPGSRPRRGDPRVRRPGSHRLWLVGLGAPRAIPPDRGGAAARRPRHQPLSHRCPGDVRPHRPIPGQPPGVRRGAGRGAHRRLRRLVRGAHVRAPASRDGRSRAVRTLLGSRTVRIAGLVLLALLSLVPLRLLALPYGSLDWVEYDPTYREGRSWPVASPEAPARQIPCAELPEPDDPLAAVVNGQEIGRAAFDRELGQFLLALQAGGADVAGPEIQSRLPEFRRQVLELLIEDVLLQQAAVELGIRVDEASVEAQVAAQVEAGGGLELFQA